MLKTVLILTTMQKKSNFLITLILLCLSTPLFGQFDMLDAEIMLDDLRKLSHDAAEGRKTGTDGNEAAKRFIVKQMDALGAKSLVKGYRHDFTFQNRSGETVTGENIISYIKGTEEGAFVITAHFDHLGVVGEDIYNGADDNASGVAAMLAFIEYFKINRPRHTMVFAALDAEEMGLQGAKAFVNDYDRIPLDQIKLNINMDMISVSDVNELFVAGTEQNPNLKPIIENIEQPGITLKFGHDTGTGSDNWTYSSDHGEFYRAGYPFLYFGVEDHPNYHKPTDTFENVDKDFYVKAAHVILESIVLLDNNLN